MFKPWPKSISKKLKSAPKSELSRLDARLWKIFSEYIRRKHADENELIRCITCGKWVHWKSSDCGHGISREELSTKFHEQNNHPQCRQCNRYKGGRQFEYMMRVDEVYGAGTAEKLRIMSKQQSKFTRFDYEYKIKEYKEKLKQLVK